MTDQKNTLVVFFLVAGLLLFAVAFWIGKRTSFSSHNSNFLAQVDRETGLVFVLRAGFAQKEKLEKRLGLNSLDSIETGDIGEALLSFEGGDRIRIFENSLITLEKVDSENKTSVVLVLKKGDLHIENLSKTGRLLIAKNGERVSAAEFENSQLKASPLQSSSLNLDSKKNDSNQLSEDEISSVLQSNRTAFDKCYLKLLQRDAQAKGQVTFSFTIENSGKLSVAEINSPQFKDEDFKKCLLDLIQRISFRPFSGPPVSTLFPVLFE